jgi:hypothetical protein
MPENAIPAYELKIITSLPPPFSVVELVQIKERKLVTLSYYIQNVFFI